MPRIGKVIAANMPHHIVQRGHNRNVVFVEQSDYRYYLDTLQEWPQALDVAVLSLCLMTNHVHLLVDPGNDTKSIEKPGQIYMFAHGVAYSKLPRHPSLASQSLRFNFCSIP